MIEAWRIVKQKHQAEAFSGEGARLFGGRWTSRGRPAVYTSATIALATLEMLVHLETAMPLKAYALFPVSIPGELVARVDPADLPDGWQAYPAPAGLQHLGDAWLDAAATPVLRVPSAIVPTEYNYLLNPLHTGFERIAIGPPRALQMDPRLVRRP